MNMIHILYETTNLVNNKKYIGIHSTKKIDDSYLGSGKILKSAIKKYGKSAFSRITILTCETREEALEAEALIVDEYFISRKDTYNIVLGGGNPPTLAVGTKLPPRADLHRQNLSKSLKGRKAHNKGVPMDFDKRQKLSEMFTGDKHPQYGIKKPLHSDFMNKYWTEEKKQEMSIKVKQRILIKTACDLCGKMLLPQHVNRHNNACQRINS